MSKKQEIFKNGMNAFYQWEIKMRDLTIKEDNILSKSPNLKIEDLFALREVEEDIEKLQDETFSTMHNILGMELNEILVERIVYYDHNIFGDKQLEYEDYFHLNITQTADAMGMIEKFAISFLDEHLKD